MSALCADCSCCLARPPWVVGLMNFCISLIVLTNMEYGVPLALNPCRSSHLWDSSQCCGCLSPHLCLPGDCSLCVRALSVLHRPSAPGSAQHMLGTWPGAGVNSLSYFNTISSQYFLLGTSRVINSISLNSNTSSPA